MTNILIRAKPGLIEHKFVDKVGKDDYCYWTMKRPPKQTLWIGSVKDIDGNKIMFTDGKNVFAEGTIIEIMPTTSIDPEHVTPGEIRFTPLKRVNYPQPKQAPTRGFTYVG